MTTRDAPYYDRPFDVILLDVGLPDINGCDVLKTIRQEEEIRGVQYERGVKIIMQTGRKEPYMEAFNRGALSIRARSMRSWRRHNKPSQ